MAKRVSIIFNEDVSSWVDYLHKHLSNPKRVNANVFHLEDKVLFGDMLDTHSESHILNSSAVIVMVTSGHMNFLLSKAGACYEKLVPNPERGIMFFVGLTEEEINDSDVKIKIRKKFPKYDSWTKVTYVNETSIKTLMEKVTEILDRPESILSKFTLVPTTVHCEEETTVVALIDTAISEEAEVRALVRGVYIDEDLPCQRVNPYSYTFVMPRSVEGEVIVNIQINKQSLRSQAKMFYKSYLSCSEQTAVSEIYCHMLDKLCCYIRGELKTLQATDDLDQRLCDVFDHTIDLPAVGYEKLFGIYEYLTEEHSKSKVPNLVHLAAWHDLKELVAHIQHLPFFTNALCINNSYHMTPRQIAESLNFKTLGEFLQKNEEHAEHYSKMFCGEELYYNKKYQNARSNSDTVDDYESVKPSEDNTTTPSDDDNYIVMSFSTKKTSTFSSSTGMSSQTDNVDREIMNRQKQQSTASSKSFISKQHAAPKLPLRQQNVLQYSKNAQAPLKHSAYPEELSSESHQVMNPSETRVPMTGKYRDRHPQLSQEHWDRNSDRSSGASSISRTSSASVVSGRGSYSSGIEEDFDPRIDEHTRHGSFH